MINCSCNYISKPILINRCGSAMNRKNCDSFVDSNRWNENPAECLFSVRVHSMADLIREESEWEGIIAFIWLLVLIRVITDEENIKICTLSTDKTTGQDLDRNRWLDSGQFHRPLHLCCLYEALNMWSTTVPCFRYWFKRCRTIRDMIASLHRKVAAIAIRVQGSPFIGITEFLFVPSRFISHTSRRLDWGSYERSFLRSRLAHSISVFVWESILGIFWHTYLTPVI